MEDSAVSFSVHHVSGLGKGGLAGWQVDGGDVDIFRIGDGSTMP